MGYKLTLNGKKADVIKAATEQSDVNIKAQNQTAEQKTSMLKLLDVLPDATLSGEIQDHNNGTITINVTARTDVYAAAQAATVKGTGMPGAAAAGRPELAPSAKAGEQPPATTATTTTAKT